MYIDKSTVKTSSGAKHTRVLLRRSYRENKKVKKETVANISNCTKEEIEAIELALKHKGNINKLSSLKGISMEQGLSMGCVWVLYEISKRLGIDKALGNERQGNLALWQIFARLIEQGSRLSSVRLAKRHAICDILSLESFNEDDLYENLDWLYLKQKEIEDKLCKNGTNDKGLFLYDVTSSYFEGLHNELSDFGYNRDKKKGKKQIVVGLLCDDEGEPVSIEVFKGNTGDTTTFASQVEKAVTRFGGNEVVFVGDRGMIKSNQIKALNKENFHYITAITKPEIEKMLKEGIFEYSLFDQKLAEIFEGEIRYILKRNPFRAQEIEINRQQKLNKFLKFIKKKNFYLQEHQRASADIATNNAISLAKKLKIDKWLNVEHKDRVLFVTINEEAKKENSKLDGCYVIKTDILSDGIDKEIIHSRYKDLAKVEQGFKNCKTSHLELRPIYLRLEERTRAHVFIVMLAYKIRRTLAKAWVKFDLTVEEGLKELSSICSMILVQQNGTKCSTIPTPRPLSQQLLSALNIKLPSALPHKGVCVDTRKKLQNQRIH